MMRARGGRRRGLELCECELEVEVEVENLMVLVWGGFWGKMSCSGGVGMCLNMGWRPWGFAKEGHICAGVHEIEIHRKVIIMQRSVPGYDGSICY